MTFIVEPVTAEIDAQIFSAVHLPLIARFGSIEFGREPFCERYRTVDHARRAWLMHLPNKEAMDSRRLFIFGSAAQLYILELCTGDQLRFLGPAVPSQLEPLVVEAFTIGGCWARGIQHPVLDTCLPTFDSQRP